MITIQADGVEQAWVGTIMRIQMKTATYVILIGSNVQQDRLGLCNHDSFVMVFEKEQNGKANLIRVDFWKGTEETGEGLLNEKDRIVSWEQGNVLAMSITVMQRWSRKKPTTTWKRYWIDPCVVHAWIPLISSLGIVWQTQLGSSGLSLAIPFHRYLWSTNAKDHFEFTVLTPRKIFRRPKGLLVLILEVEAPGPTLGYGRNILSPRNSWMVYALLIAVPVSNHQDSVVGKVVGRIGSKISLCKETDARRTLIWGYTLKISP